MKLDEYGYDKKEWLKRARAFDKIIFPSCSRRIVLQKNHEPCLIAPTMAGMMKVLRPFMQKLIEAEDAKAFYVLREAYIKFLKNIKYVDGEKNGKYNGKKYLLVKKGDVF